MENVLSAVNKDQVKELIYNYFLATVSDSALPPTRNDQI